MIHSTIFTFCNKEILETLPIFIVFIWFKYMFILGLSIINKVNNDNIDALGNPCGVCTKRLRNSAPRPISGCKDWQTYSICFNWIKFAFPFHDSNVYNIHLKVILNFVIFGVISCRNLLTFNMPSRDIHKYTSWLSHRPLLDLSGKVIQSTVWWAK